MKTFKHLSIVLLTDEYKDILKEYNDHRFSKERFFCYVGEIPNMRGHCVVIGQNTGKTYVGYHIENFRLPNEFEL